MEKFRVRCKVRKRIVANFPENVEALKYIVLRDKKKDKLTDEQAEKLRRELAADLAETIETGAEEEEVSVKSIFLRDDKGIYIKPRNIKGWLKEVYKVMGIRGARDAINHGVYVHPDRIYLTRNGEIIKEPDGELVNPIQVMSPRGPRSSVKVAEYIEAPCEFEFELRVAESVARKLFTKALVDELRELGGEVGFLGDRSLQEGQCDIEIEKV